MRTLSEKPQKRENPYERNNIQRRAGGIAEPVDAPFAMIPYAVIRLCARNRGYLTMKALGLYNILVMHADHETRQCWPSKATLAHEMGYSKAESVDDALELLVGADVVMVQPRWMNPETREHSFSRDDRHTAQTSNLYTLLTPPDPPPINEGRGVPQEQGEGGTPGSQGRGAPEAGVGPPHRHGDKQEPLNKNHLNESSLSRSTQASTAHPTSGAHFLPENWKPNYQHYFKGSELNFTDDGVNELADEFRKRMASERRSNWDKTFSNFITDSSREMDGTTYPVDDSEES